MIIVYLEWLKIILNILSDHYMYLNVFKFSEMPPSLLDFDIENISELGNDTLLNNISQYHWIFNRLCLCLLSSLTDQNTSVWVTIGVKILLSTLILLGHSVYGDCSLKNYLLWPLHVATSKQNVWKTNWFVLKRDNYPGQCTLDFGL